MGKKSKSKKEKEKEKEKDDKSDEESKPEKKSKKEPNIKGVVPLVSSIDNKKIVDKYFKDKNKYHVYADNNNTFNGQYYTTTLHNTNDNSNKFYIIQLLENDSKKKLVLYTRWGKIGSEGQKKIESVDTTSGPKLFMKKFEDKTKGGYKEVFEADDNNNEEEKASPDNAEDAKEIVAKIIELFKKKTGKECYIYEESVVNDLGILDDKMGGQPYLPKGVPYPKNSKGENMALLLQVNLSKYKLEGFPQKGIFEIFFELDPLGDGLDSEYKLFLFDENLEYQTKFPKIDYEGFYISKPLKLTFKKGISYMNFYDNNFEPTVVKCINEITHKNFKTPDEFCEKYNIDQFEDFEYKFEGEGFQACGLGVYPNFIQFDTREGDKEDYVNIFTFGSSENTFFNECCAANILIDKNDLKNGKVENAIFQYDQT